MIAASALFVVAALVLLILGTFQDGLEMIFASIAASIVAALLLFFGVLVDRRRPAPAGYSYTPPADEPSLTGVGVASQQRDEPTGYELIPEEPITTGVPTPEAFDEAPPVLLEEQEEELARADEVPTEITGAVTAARRATVSSRAAASSAKRKAAPKKTTAKKTTAKKTTAKATTAKTAAKKTTAKKSTAKATTAKKTTAKKSTAKKTTAKKTTARKTGA